VSLKRLVASRKVILTLTQLLNTMINFWTFFILLIFILNEVSETGLPPFSGKMPESSFQIKIVTTHNVQKMNDWNNGVEYIILQVCVHFTRNIGPCIYLFIVLIAKTGQACQFATVPRRNLCGAPYSSMCILGVSWTSSYPCHPFPSEITHPLW
jgi:hypothetical protein